MNVSTEIGKEYLKIVDKCFPKTHKLHPVLNRHTLKISYDTMTNMKQKIAIHNKKVLTNKENENKNKEKQCNCRNGIKSCPMDGHCLTESVVYSCKVTNENQNTFET